MNYACHLRGHERISAGVGVDVNFFNGYYANGGQGYYANGGNLGQRYYTNGGYSARYWRGGYYGGQYYNSGYYPYNSAFFIGLPIPIPFFFPGY